MEMLAEGYSLIEGPVWDPARGLLFSDVFNGGVRCLDRDGGIEVVIPHRRGIGGMALHADGGVVVSGRNVAHKTIGESATRVLFEGDPDTGTVGFNDLGTDLAGRVYVGSLAHSPFDSERTLKPGKLYQIDLDGSVNQLADDVLLTNGIAVSPAGDRLYHNDSRADTMWAYALNADGSVGGCEVLARFDDGVPDGLAVAEDGSIWVAMADGGIVRVLEPDGRERARIPVPLPMVTSVCFGGDDLRDLYVVTGSRGTGREDAGSIFRHRSEIAGLAVPPARVAVPA